MRWLSFVNYVMCNQTNKMLREKALEECIVCDAWSTFAQVFICMQILPFS